MTERASGAINRRQILQLGATGALTGLLAACTSTETPSGSSTSAGPADATGGSAVPSADPEWTTPTTTATRSCMPAIASA